MSSYGLVQLTREQCDALLQTQRVGRVGVCTGRPGVFPVLYSLLDGDVVFRTAPGEKLIAAALRRDVVFEIDAYDAAARTGWSVNVVGVAEEIEDPAERSRAPHRLGALNKEVDSGTRQLRPHEAQSDPPTAAQLPELPIARPRPGRGGSRRRGAFLVPCVRVLLGRAARNRPACLTLDLPRMSGASALRAKYR